MDITDEMIKVVFCVVLFIFASVNALCPNGWTRFLDSCYHFGHEAGTFTETENYCRQHQAHLVHVDSSTETAFLRGFLKELKRGKHWIGLTDRDIEGIWLWMDNNAVATYTDWLPGEPNGGNVDNCVAIRSDYNYQWTDDACDNRYYPICETGTGSSEIVG